MKKILVTGADGQLGKCIQKHQFDYQNIHFIFYNSKTLDITDFKLLKKTFETEKFDYCINCAAFTNVEEAEKNSNKAFLINAEGVKNLAVNCSNNNVTLLHISTDYVFDGEKINPYTSKDVPNPINEYGKSKLEGEKNIQRFLKKYFIIRTSWLYSEFGNNFYKTILNKIKTNNIIKVTDREKGCPTNANNLAKYIIYITENDFHIKYGIYHFTDKISMTWYDFAKEILKQNGIDDSSRLERINDYNTFTKRPKNSILI